MSSRIYVLLACFAFASACGGSGGSSSPTPPPPPPPPPPPANVAPTVDAGADASIQLPQTSVALDATVTDDGLPSGSAVTTNWSVQSGPAGATFADETAEDTTVTFVDAGTYVLLLTASDSELEGSDTVQITVQPPANVAPTADDQSVSTIGGTPLDITLTATDPDGNTLTYTIETPPTNGTLGPIVGAAVTYTSNTGYAGPDSFTFSASDGALSSNVATVTIDVISANAPVVTISSPADNSSFDAGTTISFQASATDIEDDDATLTAAIEWSSDLDGALGTGGTLDVSTLSSGTHVVTASVTDSDAETGSAIVNVTIIDKAYWTFDEGSGTVVADSAGDNDATNTGAAHLPGVNSSALNFNSPEDRVVVDDAAALNITGTEITLAAWIFPRDGGGTFRYSRIISKRTEADAGDGDIFGMLLRDYRLRFRLDGGSGLSGQDMDSSHIVRLNEWIHVAMVYDGVDMRIYVNGELDPATPVAKTDTIDSSSKAVHLGRREKDVYDGSNDQRAFLGLIDEAQVFGRALTAQEVAGLHAAFTPPAPAPGLFFTDITVSAGVDTLASGGRGVSFAEVTGPPAGNDSLPDYYLANAIEDGSSGRADQFYRNLGGATFTEDAAARAIDDVDGGSHVGVWADLDNDGDYDLVNGSTWDNVDPTLPTNIKVFNNANGNGSFNDVTDPNIAAEAIETRGVAVFDMDGDGNLDLFAVGGFENPGVKEAYLGDGSFGFAPHAGGDLTSAAVPTMWGVTDTDYNGDGNIDVIVANVGITAPFDTEFTILSNDGSGTFTRVPPSTLGITDIAETGITTADIDNDGDLDMLLCSGSEGYLWRQNGVNGGTYSRVSSFTGTDGLMGAFGDLDNDGFQDLVFAGEENVWLNRGDGTFERDQSVPIDGIFQPRSIAFADIDEDGDLDFAISAQGSGSRLIQNDWDNADNNWLKVQLVGPSSQAGAFGAKVFVYEAGTGQTVLLGMRESRSAQGYLSQSDPVLHFGLGAETLVDIVVEYVGVGSPRTCVDVPANARKLIDETAGNPCSPGP